MSKLHTAKVLIQKAVRDFSRTNAGQGIKQGAQYVGKGAKKVAGTIFYPIKKAHQAQGGAINPTECSDKYTFGTLAVMTGALACDIGYLSIDSCEEFNNKNQENDKRNALIASKLSDATFLGLAGLALGGPIGGAIGLIAGGTIPKDITIGLNKKMAKKLKEARKELKAERQARRTERKDARQNSRAERKEQRQAERNKEEQTVADSIKRNIKPMVPGNSTFKPDSITNTKVDTTGNVDINKVETKADTTAVADTVKTQKDISKVAVVDTAKVDKVSETEKEKVAEEKTKLAKTNFWNGELNEINVESVKVERGDCLWNIAKRELQKANQGKTITNAQIVKQVIEFGKLNPELFGENPSYKDLDFIKEGVTLKLSA